MPNRPAGNVLPAPDAQLALQMVCAQLAVHHPAVGREIVERLRSLTCSTLHNTSEYLLAAHELQIALHVHHPAETPAPGFLVAEVVR